MARRAAVVVVSMAMILASHEAYAATLGLGSKLMPFSLADQNGASHRVDESVAVIILTRDEAGGAMMAEALSAKGKNLLADHKAVYVADLSGMPGFLRNLVALPRLKDRPYPMLLDTDGEVSEKLPSKEKHATLIFLDKLQITAVEYLTKPYAVATALQAPKRFAAH